MHAPCRTRTEFNAWAAQAASQFGYAVEIEGLGTAVDEDSALSSMPEVGSDLGYSTQV